MNRPKPDPRDDKKFAEISKGLKENGLIGRISRNGDVRLQRRKTSVIT